MSDELVAVVAATLAAKGAEALYSGGRTALAALVRLVRERIGGEKALEQRPEEIERQLRAAVEEDPEFAERLRLQWRAVQVAGGVVVNDFSGRADTVVQARDIRGDLTF